MWVDIVSCIFDVILVALFFIVYVLYFIFAAILLLASRKNFIVFDVFPVLCFCSWFFWSWSWKVSCERRRSCARPFRRDVVTASSDNGTENRPCGVMICWGGGSLRSGTPAVELVSGYAWTLLNKNFLWEAMWWRGWEIAVIWGVLWDALWTRMSSGRRCGGGSGKSPSHGVHPRSVFFQRLCLCISGPGIAETRVSPARRCLLGSISVLAAETRMSSGRKCGGMPVGHVSWFWWWCCWYKELNPVSLVEGDRSHQGDAIVIALSCWPGFRTSVPPCCSYAISIAGEFCFIVFLFDRFLFRSFSHSVYVFYRDIVYYPYLLFFWSQIFLHNLLQGFGWHVLWWRAFSRRDGVVETLIHCKFWDSFHEICLLSFLCPLCAIGC